jgi:hypothetical protein
LRQNEFWLYAKSPVNSSTQTLGQAGLRESTGLLTGQSVPIFRCDREMRINADRHIFDDQ